MAIAHQGVELLGEELAGRPFLEGLDEVHHDEVEALGGVLEVRAGLLVEHARAGVVQGSLVHLGEVLPALRHHLGVDVAALACVTDAPAGST